MSPVLLLKLISAAMPNECRLRRVVPRIYRGFQHPKKVRFVMMSSLPSAMS